MLLCYSTDRVDSAERDLTAASSLTENDSRVTTYEKNDNAQRVVFWYRRTLLFPTAKNNSHNANTCTFFKQCAVYCQTLKNF